MSVKHKIVAEAERVEEDAIHSGKAHFAQAERWRAFHFWVGAPAAVLAAIAGAAVLGEFQYGTFVSVVTAFSAALLAAVMTFFDPQKQVQIYTQCGNRYLVLRNKARIFREIECEQASNDEELTPGLKRLTEERDRLNSESPVIPRWAYEKARRGIEAGEAIFKADR